MTESRLYKRLPSVPKPMFEVNASNIIRDDHKVESITINHGTTGPDEGVNPSTCEVVLPEQMIVRTRLPLTVRLTARAATEVARLVGHLPAAIRDRFTGRAGRQEIEDAPVITSKGVDYRKKTTLTAASWSAQLASAKNHRVFPNQYLIGDLIFQIMRPPHLQSRIPVEVPVATPRTHGTAEGKYSDLIGKYAADIGIMMQQQRSGRVRVLTLPLRKQDALNRLATVYPMTRSHAISPTTWEQPNDAGEERLSARYFDAGGVERVIDADGGAPGTAPLNELDWKHIEFDTNQYLFVNALESRSSTDGYTLPSITIDVLMLMNSPYVHHRYQAGYVMALNPGDTLNLSGDWHPNLRGIQFVTGIKETISADGWTFELNLTPYSHIIGEPSPVVPPRVWESATATWNETPGTWDEN